MRTVYCGDLNISNVGLKVILCGWVNRYRNFSDFIFIEIRDRSGNIQVCFDANHDGLLFSSARYLRNEFCVQVTGVVRERPVHHINHNMKTGEIEVLASHLNLVSTSDPLPLDLNNDNNSEEQRLKYRYLDLRRPIMFQRLKIRSHVTSFVHHFMEKNGFLNIETPMLTRSIPEGARDYLVYSRLHEGKFYALPQSPQLFKQLLMISGFDRYYQIIKCFRDEDMRSDRQPEFTQIDLETSFMSAKKVREIIESLICSLWYEILGVKLTQFPQLTYKDVMYRFASDRPDLRNPIEISYIDISSEQVISNDYYVSDIEKNISLKVMIMFVPYGARLSYHALNQYVDNFQRFGGGNLTWIRVNGVGYNRNMEGSAVYFFKCEILESILLKTCISEKDILFLSCSHHQFSNNALHFLRVKLGNDLQLIKKDSWAPLWVIDFPMFKKDEQGHVVSMHHVFTAPKNIDIQNLLEYPLSVLADSFDIVINGCELGSGSVRIHSYKIQKIIFKILGFSEEFQNDKFGFLLDALKYGAPIHAGIACGLDRLVMLLSGADNIRDVIAFPKTTNAIDLMTKAPSFLGYDSGV